MWSGRKASELSWNKWRQTKHPFIFCHLLFFSLSFCRMPAYNANFGFAIFFILYILINTYIFMSVFLAVVYNNYKKYLKVKLLGCQDFYLPVLQFMFRLFLLLLLFLLFFSLICTVFLKFFKFLWLLFSVSSFFIFIFLFSKIQVAFTI